MTVVCATRLGRAVRIGLLALAAAVAMPTVLQSAEAPIDKAPIAPAVTVITLKPVELVETMLLTGTLMPRDEVLVAPEIEGLRIKEIMVDEGDSIKAGQLLARLASDAIDAQFQQWQALMSVSTAQIAQAKDQITQAEAALAQSTPALTRAKDLVGQGSGTQVVLEQRQSEQRINESRLTNAKNGLAVAIADRANKEAQGTEIRVKLARTEIKSPVDGVISRRTARVGGVATAVGEPMFRLIARGEIELEAEVPELSLTKLLKGQKASVTIGSDVSVGGMVRLVSTEVDKATRLGKVRIALLHDERIHIGSFARGNLEISRRMAIALPAAALQYDGAEPYAQVVVNGQVMTHKVRPGLMTQGMVEILDGLQAGDVVIARAGAFLHDGDAVTVVVPAARL